jgi:diphosphomevalonate decarboxylase
MPETTATACANIAFIKYWGNRPGGDNLPLNPSISMTMAGCVSATTVSLRPGAAGDETLLGGAPADAKARERTTRFLERLRRLAGRSEPARVVSENSFPTGCGIASSASGFAALATAAAAAYGLRADARELSRLARLGSGSAARSIYGGFVELRPGERHEESYAEPLAPESAWPDLRDLVVILSNEEKKVSSEEGHRFAATSEMYAGRLAAIPDRAARVRRAIADRDLTALGEASEADALSMHAVMMTSHPALLYWTPRTVAVIAAVWEMRRRGIEAWFTIDAGPNVHLLTLAKDLPAVEAAIRQEFNVPTLTCGPGPGARIAEGAG